MKTYTMTIIWLISLWRVWMLTLFKSNTLFLKWKVHFFLGFRFLIQTYPYRTWLRWPDHFLVNNFFPPCRRSASSDRDISSWNFWRLDTGIFAPGSWRSPRGRVGVPPSCQLATRTRRSFPRWMAPHLGQSLSPCADFSPWPFHSRSSRCSKRYSAIPHLPMSPTHLL